MQGSIELREPVFPPSKYGRDFVWLVRGELHVLREQWFWYIVQASFAPLSYLFFLALLTDVGSTDTGFLVTGSLVTSFSFAGMLSLGQRLGGLKQQHAFEYFASLPVSKGVFIFALATQGVLLTLPSTVLIVLISRLAFDYSLPPSAIVVCALSAYSMCGFGAVIGFWSPTAEVASLTTQVIQTISIFFAPVFFSVETLPRWIQIGSRIWPSTWSAEALRALDRGESLAKSMGSVTVLACFVVVSLVLVPMRLDWRTSSS